MSSSPAAIVWEEERNARSWGAGRAAQSHIAQVEEFLGPLLRDWGWSSDGYFRRPALLGGVEGPLAGVASASAVDDLVLVERLRYEDRRAVFLRSLKNRAYLSELGM